MVFAYPPLHLLRSFVRKAMADGVRGLVLVPAAVTAAYWGRLMEAAILRPGGTRYRRLRRLDNLLVGPPELHIGELALFAVDFGMVSDRHTEPSANGVGACAGFFLKRERPELGTAGDRATREELRAAVAAQVAARDAARCGRDEEASVSLQGAETSGSPGLAPLVAGSNAYVDRCVFALGCGEGCRCGSRGVAHKNLGRDNAGGEPGELGRGHGCTRGIGSQFCGGVCCGFPLPRGTLDGGRCDS